MKRYYVISALCALLFLALIYVLKTVDVAAIGPAGTAVGLSHINQTAFEYFGESDFWYQLTKMLGFLSMAVAAFFAIAGVVQLIMAGGHFFKVDRELRYLGALYVITAAIYVLFDKVAVNCRPVLEAGQTFPEPSFPSTHTLLVFVVMGSTMILLDHYIKSRAGRRLLQIFCDAVIGVTVIGRLLSGVHWVTDIAGGILISVSLLCLYKGILEQSKHRMRKGIIME